MRPSWEATTVAFGELVRSTSCNGAAAFFSFFGDAPAAAAVGDGAAAGLAVTGAESLAADLAGAALVVAVELDGDETEESAPHATPLPLTGRRPSVSPVSVAITDFG